MTEDQFKCLFFVCADQSPHDVEIKTHLLSIVEQKLESALQKLTAECHRFKNLDHNSAIVEQPNYSVAASSVYAVTHPKLM
ncbi:unnamed protein product [Schistocephalus solidus]|uniref:Syntaxin-18 n=1 Tax=Schistocephalus solidus TaxID=70667 RepID=A0A183S7H4_SCHSO|nr:unnamed protein product [Schistocephalus solidus]